MESDDVRARRGCEDSRSVEDVGVAGNLSERCEGTDVDEIGRDRRELRENLKANVISYTTNKAEQARGGQKETTVPMELDHVIGGEMYGEDWEDVDDVRRDQRCYNCGMAGHIARDCRSKKQWQRERERRSQGLYERQMQDGERSRKKV